MKHIFKLMLLIMALVIAPMTAQADNHDTVVQDSNGYIPFGRYYWQVNGQPSGGYENHYYAPESEGGERNALTSWAVESGSPKELEAYLHMPAGNTSLTLDVTTSGSTTFQFIVKTATGTQLSSTTQTVNGTKSVSVMSNVNLPASAYYSIRIKVTSGHANISKITRWKITKTSSEQAYLPDYLSSPSVHTNEWKTTDTTAPSGNSYDWAYEEVMIPATSDIVGTYCMSLGVFHGYMGIQVNGTNQHDIIFSMWDNGSTDNDPNLPDYLRSGSLDGNGGVNLSRFGGEGTGAKAFRSGEYWVPGQWVKFLCNARPELVTVETADGPITYTNTLVTAWYKTEGGADNVTNAEEGEDQYDGWHYIATHRLSGGNTFMNGWYSFLENYNWPSGNMKRTAYYRNGALHALNSGKWSHRNYVSCSHTDGGDAAGKRNDYGTGIETVEGEPAFYMTTGGYNDDAFAGTQTMTLKENFVPVTQTTMDKLLGRVAQAIQHEQERKVTDEFESTRETLAASGFTVVAVNSEATNEGDANKKEAAIDGDENTWWHTRWSAGNGSYNYPYTIDIQLSEEMQAKEIEQIGFSQRSGTNYHGKTFKVYYSNNGTSWTAYSGTYTMEDADKQTINLNSKITGKKYIRLEFTAGYGSYLVLREIYFNTAHDRTAINEQVQAILDKENRFDGYSTADLAALKTAYNSGNWTDESAVRTALVNLAANGTLLKYGTPTAKESISSFKAYQLHNANGLGDAIVSNNVPALATPVDNVTLNANNWVLLTDEEYGKSYLYNLGAQKYLSIGAGGVTLSTDPVSVKVSAHSTSGSVDGFTIKGDTGYLTANNGSLTTSPTYSEGALWELRDNYGITPNVSSINQLLTNVNNANAERASDLTGIRPTYVSSSDTRATSTSEHANKLVDDSGTNTKWGMGYTNGSTTAWIVVQANNTILKGYDLYNGNDTNGQQGRRWKNWTVEGSNDNSSWTTIATVTDAGMNTTNFGKNSFSTESNTTKYSYYKFTITANEGGGMIQMSDLMLQVLYEGEKVNYLVTSDGVPSGVTVKIKDTTITPTESWTAGATYKSTTELAPSDVTVQNLGDGYVFEARVDNNNHQVWLYFKQLFAPISNISEKATATSYYFKNAAGYYPYVDNGNIKATQARQTASKYIFINAATVGQYYIYDISANKYVYANGTGNGGNQTSQSNSKVQMTTDQSTARPWTFTYDGRIVPAAGGGAGLNFTGGPSYVLNLYSTSDRNSEWTITDSSIGSLACAVTMFSEPGKEYIHKLIPESGVTVESVTFNGDLTSSDLELKTDRVSKGNQYKYVYGHAPSTEGTYTYDVHLSDGTVAKVKLTVSNFLQSPTPGMVWVSWNWFKNTINATNLSEIADGLKSKGLFDVGFKTIVIDDAWGTGDSNATLTYDSTKFPSGMASFVSGINAKGIKVGIYSDAANRTCGNFQPGSLGVETQHVQLFDSWGIDFLKYDFCGGSNAQKSYTAMGDAIAALNATRKGTNPDPFVFNACEWGRNNPWLWGAEAGTSMWRATSDAREDWIGTHDFPGVLGGSDEVRDLWMYAGVNRFNDLDMMTIGLHGKGSPSNHTASHQSDGGTIQGLTDDQARSQMSIWSMLASPLSLSCDVRENPSNPCNSGAGVTPLTASDLATLKNADILAISQDPLGQQAEYMPNLGTNSEDFSTSGCDVYVKDLAGGDKALAIVNRSASATMAAKTINLDNIYLNAGTTYYVKNVWTGTVTQCTGSITTDTFKASETKVYIISENELEDTSEDTPEEPEPAGPTYPFIVSPSTSDLHWQYLQIRGDKYVAYNSSTQQFDNSTTAPTGDAGLFAFVQVEGGFKIVNKAAGTDKAIYGTISDKSLVSPVNFASAQVYIYQNNNGHDVFGVASNGNAHLNDINNHLGYWVNGSSATDAGSTFKFIPAEVMISTDAVKHYYTIRNNNNPSDYAHYDADNQYLSLGTALDNSAVFYFTSAGSNANGSQLVNIHNYEAGDSKTMNDWNSWGTSSPRTWYIKLADGTTGQSNDFNIALNSNYANSWNHQSGGVKSWSAGSDRGSGWYIEEVTKKTYTIKIVGGDDNNYTVYNQGTPYRHGDRITGFFFSADNFSQDAAGNQPVKNTVTMEGEYLVFSFYEYDTVTGGTRPTDINDYSLWYDVPATKTGVGDQWMEYALPMGNGQIGATIVGGVMTDRIQFNEKTLWEGGNTNTGSQGYYQNFGSILVKDLGSNFSIANASKPVSNYVRYLDIMDGVAGVNFRSSTGSNYTRRYFTAMGQDDKVFVARYDVDGSDKLNLLFSYAPDGQINASGVTYSYDNGVAEATFHGKLTTVQYNTRFRVLTDGTLSRTDDGIRVANGTYATLLMAAATDFDITTSTTAAVSGESEQQLASRVQGRVASAAGKSYDALLAAHKAKQNEYMGRVDFHVGGASTKTTNALVDYYNASANNKSTAEGLFLEQLYFQYGRYMTVAANADQSIHAPSNLQGIWNDRSNSSFWHCDLHADINVEMNYWPADPTNLSEMHLPFLNHIIDLSTSKAWTDYAKKVSGNNSVPGWSVACESNIFGGTSQFSNGNMKTLGAWYCTHLWRYYQYTLDKDFLKKALPVMYNAALYIKSIAQQDIADRGSLYVIKGEYSPEHGDGNHITAFAQQTSSELFDEIIKAHAELGSASPLSNAQVQEISNFYANFNKGVQIETYSFNRNNVQYTNVPCIAEWMDTPLSDPGHRHLSHLMCVYPFSQITAYGTTQQEQDLFTAAGNAILARTGDVTGWSMGWQTNVYARVLKGNEARSYLSQALKHSRAYNIQMSGMGGCYYNLFDSHSPFQIDGNYGCTSGVAEMLLQSYDGTVHLLPALPDAWANGHITGLKAVGNFQVDQKWANKQLTKATIVNKHSVQQNLVVKYGETDLTQVNVTLNGATVTPTAVTGGYQIANVPANGIVVITIVEEEPEAVEAEYILTPADEATIASTDLAKVYVKFTGDDEGSVWLSEEGEMSEYVPTLTNAAGTTTVRATAFDANEDTNVSSIADYTIFFPTTDLADGQWTLTIPQGSFCMMDPNDFSSLVDVKAITATYTVGSAAPVFPAAGEYYMTIECKDTGRHPYLYNDAREATYTLQSQSLPSTLTSANNYVWRVQSDGTNLEISNGDGRTIGVNGSVKMRLEDAWHFVAKDNGYYYLTNAGITGGHECLNASNGGYTTSVGGSNVRTVTTWSGDSHNDNLWKFTPVDYSGFTVYNVAVIGCDEGYVTYNNQNAFNSGFFFVNGALSDSNVTAATFEYKESTVTIDNTNHTITVAYTSATDVEILQEKIENLLVNENLGTVGYPDWYGEEMMELAGYSVNFGEGVTDSNYAAALAAYNAVLGTDNIILPEDGKAYYFVNVQQKSNAEKVMEGNAKILKFNSADHTLTTEAYTSDMTVTDQHYFICHDLGDGKYVFVNNYGYYLRHYANSHGGALSDSYDENNDYIKVVKHATSGNTQPAIDAFFGLVALKGNRPSNSTNASIVINGNTGGFDACGDDFLVRYNAANNQYSTAFRIEEVAYPYNHPKLIKGDNGYYASIYLPFAMQVPEGIECYRGTEDRGNNLALEKMNEDNAPVPAGGYILYSDQTYLDEDPDSPTYGQELESIQELVTPADAAPEAVDNLFIGTTAEGDAGKLWEDELEGNNPYVLANKSKGIGFYRYTGTAYPKGKAVYLAGSASTRERIGFQFDDIVEAIKAAKGEETDNTVFDLTGRRLEKAAKGVNIMGGKKVLK